MLNVVSTIRKFQSGANLQKVQITALFKKFAIGNSSFYI